MRASQRSALTIQVLDSAPERAGVSRWPWAADRTYLKRCACWASGPGYLLFGDWYSWERMAWLVFWLGLLANFTVIGSVAPGGFWPFRPLIASSASIRLSNRINPTPLDMPKVDVGKDLGKREWKETEREKKGYINFPFSRTCFHPHVTSATKITPGEKLHLYLVAIQSSITILYFLNTWNALIKLMHFKVHYHMLPVSQEEEENTQVCPRFFPHLLLSLSCIL